VIDTDLDPIRICF